MLTARHQRALDAIVDRLSGQDLQWAVTGSVALALHGVATTCDDLDLVTTARGVEQIEHTFTNEIVVRSTLVERDGLRGQIGTLRVAGLPIELLGDIQNALPGGRWTTPPSITNERVWIERDDRRYPVLSLDYLHRAYTTMGRTETANIIGRAPTRTPIQDRKANPATGGLFRRK